MNPLPNQIEITLVSCPKDVADALAKQLVDSHLAGCVKSLPSLVATYEWEGEVTQAQESYLIIKSLPQNREALVNEIKRLHPYHVPEILHLASEAGDPNYLTWLTAACTRSAQ